MKCLIPRPCAKLQSETTKSAILQVEANFKCQSEDGQEFDRAVWEECERRGIEHKQHVGDMSTPFWAHVPLLSLSNL